MKRGTPLVAGVNVNTMAAIAEQYGLDSPQYLDAQRLLADTVSVIAETLWDLSQGKVLFSSFLPSTVYHI